MATTEPDITTLQSSTVQRLPLLNGAFSDRLHPSSGLTHSTARPERRARKVAAGRCKIVALFYSYVTALAGETDYLRSNCERRSVWITQDASGATRRT